MKQHAPDPCYRIDQIRQFEEAMIAQGIPAFELMQRAGQAALQCVKHHWPQAQSITVLCGSGNNGGDGLILASLAQLQGIKVRCFQWGEINREPASTAAAQARHAAIQQRPMTELTEQDLKADVIVDALFGIGLQHQLSEALIELFHQVNQSPSPRLAIDIPSGLFAETGCSAGAVINADVTITFLGYKPGLFTATGCSACGHVVFSDLHAQPEQLPKLSPYAYRDNWLHLAHELPPRPRDCHKGDFGHVLIVGGNLGMGGAVRLAGESCARGGAGLVSVATRPEYAQNLHGSRPELMVHGVTSPEQILVLCEKATVLVLGPGLGQDEWSKMLWEQVMSQPQPKVVDADALNLLAQQPRQDNNWILTPHPKEAGRLLNKTAQEIQTNRFEAVAELQNKYGGVALLKGAGTLIQGSTGIPFICDAGNPGMATGGMGDVLSGLIGALVAQQLPLEIATRLGVQVHARAADRAAAEGERGLLPLDLMPFIREYVNVRFSD